KCIFRFIAVILLSKSEGIVLGDLFLCCLRRIGIVCTLFLGLFLRVISLVGIFCCHFLGGILVSVVAILFCRSLGEVHIIFFLICLLKIGDCVSKCIFFAIIGILCDRDLITAVKVFGIGIPEFC